MSQGTNDPTRASYLIADLPEHERPRERLLREGAGVLKEEELLALILRAGHSGRSTLDLARELLKRYDNQLSGLAAADPADLVSIHGIGPAKAAELKATFELASRMAAELHRQRPAVVSAEAAADRFRDRFRGKKQEELWVLLLDTRSHVIRDALVTIGLLDRSQVHAREVFRLAIQHAASKLVLIHNHPSGDPTPSAADVRCTRELVAAGKIVDIEVIDHIVIGDRSESDGGYFYSFRESGLIA